MIQSAISNWKARGWLPAHNDRSKQDEKQPKFVFTRTKTSEASDCISLVTQPLSGNPTRPQTQNEIAKQLQLGCREKERMFILGACELFADTPVLVDYTKFDLFQD